MSFSFSRIFSNLEFHEQTNEKSHASNISYKACKGKTVILSYTHNEYRHYSLVFVHGHHMYVYIYVQEWLRTQDSLQYSYAHKESSLIRLDPFLVQGDYSISTRPRYSLRLLCYVATYVYVLNYLAGPAYNCMLHSASYYFHLKLWTEWV